MEIPTLSLTQGGVCGWDKKDNVKRLNLFAIFISKTQSHKLSQNYSSQSALVVGMKDIVLPKGWWNSSYSDCSEKGWLAPNYTTCEVWAVKLVLTPSSQFFPQTQSKFRALTLLHVRAYPCVWWRRSHSRDGVSEYLSIIYTLGGKVPKSPGVQVGETTVGWIMDTPPKCPPPSSQNMWILQWKGT